MKFDWETIHDPDSDNYDTTYRAKVQGGWIVRHFELDLNNKPRIPALAMVFVPDQEHEWVIEE